MTMTGTSLYIVFKAVLGSTCCLGHLFFQGKYSPHDPSGNNGLQTPLATLFVPVPPQTCSLHLLIVPLASGPTAAGPSVALSSLFCPISTLMAPGTPLALGQTLASPHYGPVRAQGRSTRKRVRCPEPPETGKL